MNKLIKGSIAVIACFGITLVACKNGQEKRLPTVSTITQSVYASVLIQPDSMYNVFAAVGGILEKNLVNEGDTVAKGSPLFKVVNTAQKLTTANTRLSLNLAQQNLTGSANTLRSLEDEINTARLTLYNDSINYERQKNLWSQQIGSALEYDTKRLKYNQSKNRLSQLRANYLQVKNELETGLNQAKNTYNASLITASDFTVKSEINGTVYALFKSPGEVVTTVEPLAQVGSSHDFLIQMLVDEVDIVKVVLNQQVIVRLDAYKDTVFTARVSKIYPQKDVRNQTFLVEGVFNDPPVVLFPGLAGEASIVINQKQEALVIPKAYLTDQNKVLTKDGVVQVVLGLQSMNQVEIISGITKDTWIYKPEE